MQRQQICRCPYHFTGKTHQQRRNQARGVRWRSERQCRAHRQQPEDGRLPRRNGEQQTERQRTRDLPAGRTITQFDPTSPYRDHAPAGYIEGPVAEYTLRN